MSSSETTVKPRTREAIAGEAKYLAKRAIPPRLRTMRQFAEDEIVIPDGPFAGLRYSCERLPYVGLWFDLVDSGRFHRFAALGPTQSGKTLTCSLIPLLYHLFEIEETVVFGLPDMDMAYDKWMIDIKPVIDVTKYAELIPKIGRGSRGGAFDSIRFTNGATMKFMTGGGGDKSRAGFTSRVIIITEVDGMDEPGRDSRETDKISQIEARTEAFDVFGDPRVYLECTVTTDRGRIWREYANGSAGRIVTPCPLCGAYVSPEREHLLGWQEAETELQAFERSRFYCPECGDAWSDDDRRVANTESQLVHKGQEIDARGKIDGELPETMTAGFRWSAVHNLLKSPSRLGWAEWKSQNDPDEENSEKARCQQDWATPFTPPDLVITPLETRVLQRRTRQHPRGLVPAGFDLVGMHIDLGKYLCHWMLMAGKSDATAQVVDWSVLEVQTDELGETKALLVALSDFAEVVRAGFLSEDQKRVEPAEVWIDCGWATDVAFEFCRQQGHPFYPARGFGTSFENGRAYARVERRGRKRSNIRHVGEEYHIEYVEREGVIRRCVNADYWKTRVHDQLSMNVNSPGALAFYSGTPRDHLSLVKHLTAEEQEVEFTPARGTIVKWIRKRRNNHGLDNAYNCAALLHLLGARFGDTSAGEPVAPKKTGRAGSKRVKSPSVGGRPYFILDR